MTSSNKSKSEYKNAVSAVSGCIGVCIISFILFAIVSMSFFSRYNISLSYKKYDCDVYQYSIETKCYRSSVPDYDVYEDVFWLNETEFNVVQVKSNFDTYRKAQLWAENNIVLNVTKVCYVSHYYPTVRVTYNYDDPQIHKTNTIVCGILSMVSMVCAIIGTFLYPKPPKPLLPT